MALFRNSVTAANQTHDMAATPGRARALSPPHALRKVFHLVDSFNVGGTETQAVQLALRIPKAGNDVTLGCLSYAEVLKFFRES